MSNEQDFVPHNYCTCGLRTYRLKLGNWAPFIWRLKSYPEKEGHPPSPVNFRDRLYEKKVVPAKQQLTTALAHAMIVSP